MNIEKVRKEAEEMLLERLHDYSKIEVKCWVYHSESRIRNGNEPFTFENYSYCLGKDVPLDYIKWDLIDVSDIGGKEKAIEVVIRWYSLLIIY